MAKRRNGSGNKFETAAEKARQAKSLAHDKVIADSMGRALQLAEREAASEKAKNHVWRKRNNSMKKAAAETTKPDGVLSAEQTAMLASLSTMKKADGLVPVAIGPSNYQKVFYVEPGKIGDFFKVYEEMTEAKEKPPTRDRLSGVRITPSGKNFN